MTANFQQSLLLSIKPSRLLKQVLIALHLLVLFVCWLSAIPAIIKGLITILIIYSLRQVFTGKTDISRCCWLRNNSGGGWEIAEQEHNYQVISILPSTVITSWLTVIHYRTTDQVWQSLVVVRDSLSPDNYRQLIVKLKVIGAK